MHHAMTVTEKLIFSHLVDRIDGIGANRAAKTGDSIAIKIDQTLTQDATGTLVYLQFETIGIPRVKTEISVSYIDHNTLQTDYKNMDDHIYLQDVAAKYGIWFSRAGNGICHQVHLEKFGKPGKTLLGSDSHTPTAGALAMLAIGAGGLDVAVAMGGGAFHLNMPRVIGVHLTGKLKNGVAAKDVILELLRRETVKGGVGAVYEYFGEGVQNLSVPERGTITNMGAELGATTSVFPSDANTKQFLTALGRQNDWMELVADSDAPYAKVIEINLSELEPLAACPHSPDNVRPIAGLAGKKVSQVCIGSCTNSSLADLAKVAAIVRGKHIAQNVEAGIAPGSRDVMLAAEKMGILYDLSKAGFRILECACGPCIGMGFAPNSAGVSLRTFNRNFKGRSGTPDAEVYLVSPETAAASALTGEVSAATIPDHDKNRSAILSQTETDAAMLIPPLDAKTAAAVEIVRGPNIKPCPSPRPFSGKLKLAVILKAGDNVSTDDIMPAGTKVLPFRSNVPEIAKFTFERICPDFYERAQKNGFADSIVLGGENYGQGSSREHAALGPMYLGVRAVLVKSFARIHKANLINYGIIPVTLAHAADYEKISEGDTIELEFGTNAANHKVTLAKATGERVELESVIDLDERSKAILVAGGLANYTRNGGQ
ncbi:MAG: aconitate hydratase [Treponemataceae bacterium]|nr:MAG: aconitate hydratase [Treponemataceae bacterium]